MSIASTQQPSNLASQQPQDVATSAHPDLTSDCSQIYGVLENVQAKTAPVWPLKDYVAVNPYAGVSDQKFLTARQHLRAVSDLETLMSVDYYRQQFADGLLRKADIDAAVDELVADGVTGAERIDVNQVVAFLREESDPSPTADAEFAKSGNHERPLRSFAETLDKHTDSHWCHVIRDEISKHCSAHYDTGQATWSSPWQELPLFQAWRSAAQHDRTFDILGVAGFRKWVAALPHDPHAALVVLLGQLGVPAQLWEDFLLCESLTMPGWSAWTKYQHGEAEKQGEEDTDFAGLLTIRLAYEVALSNHFNFRVDWSSIAVHHAAIVEQTDQASDEDLLRYALLKASEIAFRKRLLGGMTNSHKGRLRGKVSNRGLAQMVFCIDVRSERIRRHLEATSSEIETFGFAGFFGLPIESVPLGEAQGSAQVPALISPHFKVHEEVDTENTVSTDAAIEKRSTVRFLRKFWKEFQTSTVSCFAFVETTGLFYGFKLLARSIGSRQSASSRFDGVKKTDQPQLGPTLRGLSQQGVTTSKQADMAESILRGIGIVDNFARMVVFCGHGSQTENNPLQAGLDCGACGGHSGEANARFAAKLLNQKYIRHALAERGILIPDDTQFVAAIHNTTTDELEFFDTHELPISHAGDANHTIEWLIISHNDALMVHSLSKALPGEAAAVLEVSEDTWDFEGQELPETIEWALQRGKIKHLVLVGNSQAGGSASRASLAPSNGTSEDAPPSSYERLIAGVSRTNALNREAQERFASHVQQMSQIPVVHNRWTDGELAVYGLFYRVESGLFLAYDAEQESFRPLM